MPLFELFRMAKSKLDSSQEKPNSHSNDFPRPGDNISELVWENGQVMMQGQSCRGRKPPSDDNSLQSNSFKPSFGDNNAKIGKLRSLQCGLSEFPASVPSSEIGLNQDEDIEPWLNYPIGGRSLQDSCCSDILPEFTGSVNEVLSQRSYEIVDKSCSRLYRNSDTSSLRNNAGLGQENALKFTSCTIEARDSSSHLQSQSSLPSLRSRAVDSISTSTRSATCPAVSEYLTGLTAPVAVHSSVKVQRLDSGLSTSSAGLTNFPCFTQPAYHSKYNVEDRSRASSSGLPCKLQSIMRDKISCIRSLNQSDPKFVTLSGSKSKEARACNQNLVANEKVNGEKADAKKVDDTLSCEHSRAVPVEVASKNDKFTDHSRRENEIKGNPDNERTMEPVAGASSVCSDSSVGRGASDDQKPNLKRKSRDTEESDSPSEEVEEELVPIKKQTSTGGSTAKRSRAAEVHNLSERRRRDRINEKMRALQELIPNCNKVDKASMLDEAIEYLKSLQLQVQVMTMGAGMYMPHMMLPTGMQQLHPAQFAHMPRMGVGMGAGIGFGMGILDINSLQVPPMQGTQYPSPLMSGPPAFHGMPGSNLQMFGLPGQGLPFSMPRPPFIPLSGRPLMRPVPVVKSHGVPGTLENPDSAQPSNSKEQVHNISKQAGQSGISSCLTNHVQAGLVQDNSQISEINAAKSAELVNEKDTGRATASHKS